MTPAAVEPLVDPTGPLEAVLKDDQTRISLMAFAMSLLGRLRSFVARSARAEMAQDIVQETMTRAWQCKDRFQGNALQAQAWLRQILVNVEHESARASRRLPASLVTDAEAPPASEPDESILVSLEKLSTADQQIIRWAHLEQLSHREIAERHGITVGASRVCLARAMKNLRAIAAKEGC